VLVWANAGPESNAHAAAPIRMVRKCIFFPARKQ